MRDRLTVLRHREEVLLRVLDGLRDRQRDLARLAVPDADPVDLVADDDERREREPPAALDDLRNAVDLDDPLLQLSRFGDIDCHQKFKSSLARTLGESLHASVIQVAAAVEHDRFHAGLLRSGGERLADLMGLGGLVALRLDADPVRGATVLPAASSTICANMPRFERNTIRRGRSALPATLPRTRRCRRSRASRYGEGAGGGEASRARAGIMLSSRPCGGRTRPRSGCPCPCRAPAGVPCGSRRRSDRRPACRSRG